MKRSLLIVALLAVCCSLLAQKLVTEGKSWQVLFIGYGVGGPPGDSLIQNFTLQEEHVINGHTYRALYFQESESNQTLQGYLREENDKVYHIAVKRDQTLSSEGLLYDFSLNVNDIACVDNYFSGISCNLNYHPMRIKSVDTEEVNGVMRKKMELDKYFGLEEYWYESIGSSLGIVYSAWDMACSCSMKLLLCKKGDGTILYSESSPTGIAPPSESDKNKVYVDVTKQVIVIDETLQNQSLTVELVDLQGNTIWKETNTGKFISIAHLPGGIYLCRIWRNGRIIYSDKILKR